MPVQEMRMFDGSDTVVLYDELAFQDVLPPEHIRRQFRGRTRTEFPDAGCSRYRFPGERKNRSIGL